MIKHVFLTGEKHIGKSTLLKMALLTYKGKTGGFFTVRTNIFLGSGYSVHIFPAGGKQVPTAENLLFVCGNTNTDTADRFNTLGCAALARNNVSLFIMDELGPHEAEAEDFRKKVMEILDGDIPVFGVLQTPADRVWTEIASRKDIKVITVTKENRNSPVLISEIQDILKLNT